MSQLTERKVKHKVELKVKSKVKLNVDECMLLTTVIT